MTEVFAATNCYQCRFFYGKNGVICAVHPSGASSEFCPDFEPRTLTSNEIMENELENLKEEFREALQNMREELRQEIRGQSGSQLGNELNYSEFNYSQNGAFEVRRRTADTAPPLADLKNEPDFPQTWADYALIALVLATPLFFLIYSSIQVDKYLDFRSDFHSYCHQYLEKAAATASLHLASQQMTKALSGCQQFAQKKDWDWWYKNLRSSQEDLLQVSSKASAEEKYYTLKQVQEALAHEEQWRK